jgi:hypothetical protein
MKKLFACITLVSFAAQAQVVETNVYETTGGTVTEIVVYPTGHDPMDGLLIPELTPDQDLCTVLSGTAYAYAYSNVIDDATGELTRVPYMVPQYQTTLQLRTNPDEMMEVAVIESTGTVIPTAVASRGLVNAPGVRVVLKAKTGKEYTEKQLDDMATRLTGEKDKTKRPKKIKLKDGRQVDTDRAAKYAAVCYFAAKEHGVILDNEQLGELLKRHCK